MNTIKATLGRDGNVHNHSHRPLIPWTQDLPLTRQNDALNQVNQDGYMPCVKRHYTNPKNVFTPNPLNPSPIGEVACHGLEWHSGPCPTLTYPWLDLESIGLRELPHADDLTT